MSPKFLDYTFPPIFPDCAFSDACQCAKRGYQYDRDRCEVPVIAAAAAAFGIDPRALFEGRTPALDVPPPGSLEAELLRFFDAAGEE